MKAQELINLSVEERKLKIMAEIDGYDSISDDLEKAKKLSDVINTFITPYIAIQIANDNALGSKSILNNPINLKNAIDEKFIKFLPIAILALKNKFDAMKATKATNLYEQSGAYKLAFANNATRTISTTMGLFLESITSISPYTVNPEKEFGIKIKGVDLISQNKDTLDIEYQQVKTKQDTLTGSQKERVEKELILHINGLVCACFPLGGWTFNSKIITRISGKDFWDRIDLPYDVVLGKVEVLILKLEDEYIKIVDEA